MAAPAAAPAQEWIPLPEGPPLFIPAPPMDSSSPPTTFDCQPVVLPPDPPMATHLLFRNQRFESSVAGLRSYLDSIQATEAGLYGQLAPDLERLESRNATARTVLLSSVGVGVAVFLYGLIAHNDCRRPAINDPDFAARSAAWDACDQDNLKMMSTFALLGIGSISVGGLFALAETSGPGDLQALVNKHNRLSPEPLRFEVSYDPARRLARGGATLRF